METPHSTVYASEAHHQLSDVSRLAPPSAEGEPGGLRAELQFRQGDTGIGRIEEWGVTDPRLLAHEPVVLAHITSDDGKEYILMRGSKGAENTFDAIAWAQLERDGTGNATVGQFVRLDSSRRDGIPVGSNAAGDGPAFVATLTRPESARGQSTVSLVNVSGIGAAVEARRGQLQGPEHSVDPAAHWTAGAELPAPVAAVASATVETPVYTPDEPEAAVTEPVAEPVPEVQEPTYIQTPSAEVSTDGPADVTPVDGLVAGGVAAEAGAPDAPGHEESGLSEAHVARTMDGLRDWGIQEGTTPEQAIRALDATRELVDGLLGLTRFDGDLVGSLNDLQWRFEQSIGDGRVHFGFHDVQPATERLDQLLARVRGVQDASVVMPPHIRSELDALVPQIYRVREVLDRVAPWNMGGSFMYPEAVQEAVGYMYAGSVGNLSQTMARLQSQIDQERIALMGYSAAMETGQAKQEQFQDDRINELAAELRDAGVGEAQIASAVVAMERYVDDAIDNGALKVTFPDRVKSNRVNQEKVRNDASGRSGRAPSRTIVAEMAVDMLRGVFDAKRSNAAPIEVNGNGEVIGEGQHRAAALMTLYGQRWMEEARKAGFEITRK